MKIFKREISMLSLLTVVFAFGIAIIQFFKDAEQKKEVDDRNAEINRVNDLLQAKQDKINELLGLSLKESKKLNRRQAEAISLQNRLDKFVTGGGNKPIIEINSLPIMRYPGHENLPRERQEKYKPVICEIVNHGDVPLRNVSVRISGSMGFDFKKLGDEASPDLGYREIGPISLPVGRRVTFFKGNYATYQKYLKFAIDITWENGFYTMITEREAEIPFGTFKTINESYSVGNKKVEDKEAFFDIKDKNVIP